MLYIESNAHRNRRVPLPADAEKPASKLWEQERTNK